MVHVCQSCGIRFNTGEAHQSHVRNHHPGRLEAIERVLDEAASSEAGDR